jgi:hypothetical protein
VKRRAAVAGQHAPASCLLDDGFGCRRLRRRRIAKLRAADRLARQHAQVHRIAARARQMKGID